MTIHFNIAVSRISSVLFFPSAVLPPEKDFHLSFLRLESGYEDKIEFLKFALEQYTHFDEDREIPLGFLTCSSEGS